MPLTKVSYSMIQGAAYNVLDFGADVTGTNDSTSSIQAAMDAAASTDSIVYIPAGTYKITGTGISVTGPITIVGEGVSSSLINANGNVLRVSGTKINVFNISITATDGHAVLQSGNVDQGTWQNVQIIQQSSAYSVWENATHQYIDMRFRDCYLQHVVGASVAGFNLVAAGGTINDNVWETTRVYGSGNYFWNVESTTDNYQFNNTWRDITFEVCTGGGIRLVAVWQYEIDNCANWDAQVSGPVLKNFYSIEKSASYSKGCKGIVRRCARWAGVNDTGIYDVVLPASGLGSGTIIESCTSAGTGATSIFSCDFKGNSVTVIAASAQFSAANDTLTTYIAGANIATNGVSFPATQSASTDPNTLDDYEEGTFTPVIAMSGSAGVGTYTQQTGRYTKIGDTVFFTLTVIWNAHTGTGAYMEITTSLPYISASSQNWPVSLYIEGLPYTGYPQAYVLANYSKLEIGSVASGGSFSKMAPQTSGTINISGFYKV